MVHVHFVGFRTDEQWSAAVKVWGKPDFVHRWHDHRMYGDIDTGCDTVIFAGKAHPDHISKYNWQDHQLH